MGTLQSYLFGCVDDEASQDRNPDPTTGLSERDRYLIKKSWAGVSSPRVLEANGVELFLQLFTKFPYMKSYFPDFKDMGDSELKVNRLFKAHVSRVMYMLSAYVQNMDDPKTLVALVGKVVRSHSARNVTHADFENLKSMFVPFLKSLLGEDTVTQETEDAWKKLLTAQNAIFAETLKMLNE